MVKTTQSPNFRIISLFMSVILMTQNVFSISYKDTIDIEDYLIEITIDDKIRESVCHSCFVENFGEFIHPFSFYANKEKSKLIVVNKYVAETEQEKNIDSIMYRSIANSKYRKNPYWIYKEDNGNRTYLLFTDISLHGKRKRLPLIDSIQCEVSYCTIIENSLLWVTYYSLESVYSFSYEEVMEMMKSIRVYKKEDE